MKLFLSAILPVIIIIVYINFKDKYEKEPKKLLFYSFLLGAILSVIISTLLYSFFDHFLTNADELSLYDQFIKAFFVVALIEEFSKYIIVRFYAQPKKAFNEPFDGIVYSVMVSMGFAAIENLFYVLEGGMNVAVIRSLTAVPAHATFAILMGYYMGIAKFSNHKRAYNLFGLLLAIISHGTYDFFLFIDFIPGIYIGAFLSLLIGLILSRKAIKKHQANSFFKK